MLLAARAASRIVAWEGPPGAGIVRAAWGCEGKVEVGKKQGRASASSGGARRAGRRGERQAERRGRRGGLSERAALGRPSQGNLAARVR